MAPAWKVLHGCRQLLRQLLPPGIRAARMGGWEGALEHARAKIEILEGKGQILGSPRGSTLLQLIPEACPTGCRGWAGRQRTRRHGLQPHRICLLLLLLLLQPCKKAPPILLGIMQDCTSEVACLEGRSCKVCIQGGQIMHMVPSKGRGPWQPRE